MQRCQVLFGTKLKMNSLLTLNMLSVKQKTDVTERNVLKVIASFHYLVGLIQPIRVNNNYFTNFV